ncbi:MAG: hypothetical protein Q4D21_04875 [Phascolarctobacterium sp.]|nr:hypothetical protein [Phascolarctobacterium sp.]
MKKIILTLALSCLSVSTCFAYKGDLLDRTIQQISNNKEAWNVVCESVNTSALGAPRASDWSRWSYDKRVIELNKQIRYNYGHSFVNIFRDAYSPDYKKILLGTADKLDLSCSKDVLINDEDYEKVEKLIVAKVVQEYADSVIKKYGPDAWKKIEESTKARIDAMHESKALSDAEYQNIKGGIASAGVVGALTVGSLSGFAPYMLATSLIYDVGALLGLEMGFGFAAPFMPWLGVVLGPVGWTAAGVFTAFTLGNTNWDKTIQGVVLIYSYRQQFKYADRLAKVK